MSIPFIMLSSSTLFSRILDSTLIETSSRDLRVTYSGRVMVEEQEEVTLSGGTRSVVRANHTEPQGKSRSVRIIYNY